VYERVDILRHRGAYGAERHFGGEADPFIVCLGHNVVTVSDDKLHIYYTSDGDIARRFRDCESLDDAKQVWHDVLTDELRKDPELIYTLVLIAQCGGRREGREEKKQEILNVLGITG